MSAPAVSKPIHSATKPIAGPGRPDRYKLGDGKQVPSVTTITGRFKNATALLAWANREGLAGRDLNEARDAAADAGHVSHQWIQDEIHGRPLTSYTYSDDATLAHARNALEAFRRWAKEASLRIVVTEIPLVSEEHRFGGTLDAIGWVFGELSLLDWKTGNGVYPEHVQQQAAYRELLREEAVRLKRDPLTVPKGAVLIRLDKETGDPHAKILPPEALDLGWEYFIRCRGLYELDKDVAKLVAKPKPKKGKAGAEAGA